MTVLPVKDVLSPDIAELGLSFANVALARSDEEVKVALARLEHSIRTQSIEINRQTSLIKNLDGILKTSSGDDIRDLLELLSILEERQVGLIETLADVLGKTKDLGVHVHTTYEGVFDAAQDLLSAWRDVYIRLVRRARLSVIMFVFRRAQARGVPDTQPDAGFEEWFLAASPEEADSWQETAYLLAVPESADRLLRSIRMSSQDRTDQIIGSIG